MLRPWGWTSQRGFPHCVVVGPCAGLALRLWVGDGCPKISCHHGAQGGAYFQQGDAQTWSVVQRGPRILYTTALLPGLCFGDSS